MLAGKSAVIENDEILVGETRNKNPPCHIEFSFSFLDHMNSNDTISNKGSILLIDILWKERMSVLP